MPVTTIKIPNGFATITEAIARTTIKQLAYYNEMQVGGIIFNSLGEQAKNPNAVMRLTHPNALASKDLITCRFTEEFKESFDPSVKNRYDNPPIYANDDLGVHIHPLTNRVMLTIECKYRSRSYNDAQAFLHNFRTIYQNRSRSHLHDLNYNYTIPDTIMGYIYDVHNATQVLATEPESLKDFFERGFSKGLNLRESLNGNNRKFIMNVVNSGCLGKFESIPEEVNVNREKGICEVAFTYVIEYDRPVSLYLEYQKFVCNQRIDKDYIQAFKQDIEYSNPAHRLTLSNEVTRVLKSADQYKFLYPESIFFDDDDLFIPKTLLHKNTTLLMLPINLDINNLTSILNLYDIPDDRFAHSILDSFKELHQTLTDSRNSFFSVTLHEVGSSESIKAINVSDELTVTSIDELDVNKRYYLRLSMKHSLNYISSNTAEYLRNRPTLLLAIIRHLMPDFDDLRTIGDGIYVTKAEFDRIADLIDKGNKFYNLGTNTHRFYYLNQNITNKLRG